MKKLLILLLLLLPSCLYGETVLVIYQKSGEVFSISFEKKPKLTFKYGYMRMESIDGLIDFPLDNLSKYTISDVPSSSNIHPITQNDCLYQISQGKIFFRNILSKTVQVYNLQGQSIRSIILDDSGVGEINLKTLPNGILVIKAGNISFKIQN